MIGGGDPQIYLSWLGGACCNPTARLTRLQGVAMTAAGPLFSLAIAGAALVVLMAFLGVEMGWETAKAFMKREDAPVDCSAIPFGGLCTLFNVLTISVWLTIINLLPIFPLDGGQMLAGIIVSMRKTHIISLIASLCLLLVFVALGMWLLVVLV